MKIEIYSPGPINSIIVEHKMKVTKMEVTDMRMLRWKCRQGE